MSSYVYNSQYLLHWLISIGKRLRFKGLIVSEFMGLVQTIYLRWIEIKDLTRPIDPEFVIGHFFNPSGKPKVFREFSYVFNVRRDFI